MLGAGNRTADIAVVGAGVMGASIAFHLAQRRPGSIVVLEKDHTGQGASGRSSALVRMHYSFAPEVQLAVKSLEIFQGWEEIVGEPSAFRKTGFVRLVPKNELDRLKANVAMQKACGARAEVIGCDDLRKLEPDWNLDDNPAAAYEPDGGYGDGAIVASDFMGAARTKGVSYLPRTNVMGFLLDGDRICGIRTDKGDLEAPVVVLATGQWSGRLLEKVGVSLPIETEFHQVAILRNVPEMKAGGCACIDSVTTLYFRSDGPDKTLIGDFYGQKGIDPDQFPQHPSDEWLIEIGNRACQRIPRLRDAGLMRGITGVYDMTPDSRPLLGEVPGIRGLYIVAGFSGMGFKISPAVGLVMSELLLDGSGQTVDISAFRPERFQEGKPIKAEFEYQNE
jgi:glycine/D-amino acid oxidase-like deaminating enzyme